jgi:hypothetical protein
MIHKLLTLALLPIRKRCLRGVTDTLDLNIVAYDAHCCTTEPERIKAWIIMGLRADGGSPKTGV